MSYCLCSWLVPWFSATTSSAGRARAEATFSVTPEHNPAAPSLVWLPANKGSHLVQALLCTGQEHTPIARHTLIQNTHKGLMRDANKREGPGNSHALRPSVARSSKRRVCYLQHNGEAAGFGVRRQAHPCAFRCCLAELEICRWRFPLSATVSISTAQRSLAGGRRWAVQVALFLLASQR